MLLHSVSDSGQGAENAVHDCNSVIKENFVEPRNALLTIPSRESNV